MRAFLSSAAAAAFFVLAIGAGGADTFTLRLVSQTSSTITLGWDPQPGFGYLFSTDGRLVSRTNDPNRSTVRFAKGASSYEVAVIVKGLVGTYPPPAPPPPPAVCSDGLDNDGDGKVDYPADPGCSNATDGDETDVVQPPPGTFSFQKAYDAAADGATVAVPAGVVATDAPTRGASTVFGGTKRVTFVCADPNGQVTQAAGWFTIKASNVTVRGGCFHLNSVRMGEPGDSTVTASNVTVDGIHMQGLEVVGAQQITVKNSEIGPNVLCYAQGSSEPAGMKCDPNGPAYEAMWAGGGSQDYPFQPYVHNNKGGVLSSVVMDNNYVHDIQTKDGNRLHTGCGLVWQSGGAPGTVTIRNSRFERCAVLGILFEGADGVVLENNWMGPPVEPLSNANGGQEAGSFAKEIIAGSGYDTVDNWRVTGNTFCHGTRSSWQSVNVVFSNNDLGLFDAPWSGAVYTGNRAVGGSC